MKPLAGVYSKDPFAARPAVSEPWAGPLVSVALSVSPWSLASTPFAAATVSVPPVVTLYASFNATTAALFASTVIVTVASGLYSTPSNTEYLNVNAPTPAGV